MLRRTFAKTLLGICAIPVWPLPKLHDKLSNSDLIKKLLKEKKDFTITCGEEKFNIIRKKRPKYNFPQDLVDAMNEPKDKWQGGGCTWPAPCSQCGIPEHLKEEECPTCASPFKNNGKKYCRTETLLSRTPVYADGFEREVWTHCWHCGRTKEECFRDNGGSCSEKPKFYKFPLPKD